MEFRSHGLVITDKDDAKRKMVASRLSPDNRYCRVLELPIHPRYAKILALLFGVVFLLIGILGFVPAVAPNEMLLNIFHVNAAHNAVHLLTGIAALLCGMAGVGASKTFFKIFGSGLWAGCGSWLRRRRWNVAGLNQQ